MLSTIVWATRPLVLAVTDYRAYTMIGLGVVWAGIFCYAKMSISSAKVYAKSLPVRQTLYQKKKDPSIQISAKTIFVSKVKADATAIMSSAQGIASQISSLDKKRVIFIVAGAITLSFAKDLLVENQNLFPSIPIILAQSTLLSSLFAATMYVYYYIFLKPPQQAQVLVFPYASTDSSNLIDEQQKILFEKIKGCFNQIKQNKEKVSYSTNRIAYYEAQIEKANSDNTHLYKEQDKLQREFERLTAKHGNMLKKEYATLQQMRQELALLNQAHAT